jgi:hypothetical protein
MLEALTLHLIREHGGITVTVTEAAEIVGISREHAYLLAAQRRFPVLGITGVRADRESMRVLIPHLVEWMYAGGTQQYDPAPVGVAAHADRPRRGAAQDPELAWLDAQLAMAPTADPSQFAR